ncbi:hypothetical protein V6N11_075994 [Hibiscus sabdariffa]|uniref:ACB domain-containing protein n=1 Tax=Hibiscus sabdariffa TaxID=183260 RepID=A0ABR2Q4Y6_9ROSI
MDIFFEFLFTVSFSFIGSFILDKLLSFSSIIDQHLEILSGSYVEVTTESAEHVFECEKGIGFVSEAVKNDAFGESVEEIDTHEEFLDGSERSSEVKEGTFEGEENFVGETTKVGLAKEDEEEIGGLECEKEDEKDCLMKGLYDDDDDDWEIIERTELEKDFGKAVCLLECKRNADKDFKLGNDLKIQLYGLHKIATEGPCYEPQPMPFKLSARAKWDAWKRLGSMSQEAAMELYIILVSNSISGFVQDDVCGDGKQDSADTKANTKLPVDVETMSVNQAIDVDYNSTSNELTAPIQSSDGIKSAGEPVRHVAGSGKGPEWRVKSALVASSSAANVVTEVAMADSAIKAAFDPVVEPVLAAEAIGGCEFPGDVSDELAMMDATCISPGLQDYTVGGFEVACNVEEQDNLVQTGKVAPQVDEFPPLQSHSLKKSKQRGGVGKPATLVGSKNKFEILNEITNEVVVVPRKPRVAYLGVANLWQELRTKKIDKINSKGSETSSSLGGALLCNDSSFLECQGV